MNKKFTKLIAAFALLVFMTPSLAGWGQNPVLTSDLVFGTPIKNENFNSLNTCSASGNTSSATTIDNLTAYGVFNKIYVGKAKNTYSIKATGNTANKVYELKIVGENKAIIASITNPAVSFGTTGAFSLRVVKGSKGYFGIYAADDTNPTSKAKHTVYLKIDDGDLSIFNSTTTPNSIGTYTNDTIEVCVIYNNTTSATTYGNSISLAAKTTHVYVNGSSVMDGASPKNFPIQGADLTVFRFCPDASAVNNYCTIDDLKIYDALPTAPAATVTAPTISPNGGTFHGTQTVTITADDGCYIMYTLDGSDPIEDPNNTAEYYVEPLNINSTTTVKAYAFDDEWNNSEVTTAVFTKEKAATPTFSVEGGYYLAAQSVSLSCTTEGAEFIYTTDGSDPRENPEALIYDGPISISATTTLKAVADVSGYDWSEVATATYTILNPADATTLTAAKTAYLNDNTQTAAFINLANVEVVGQTGNYLFLQDANVGVLVFGSGAPTFTKGDKFTSGYLTGTFATYGANTELTDFAFFNVEKTSGNDLTVTSATIESVLGNWTNYEDRCVSISGSYINTGWILNDGNDHTLTFYDNVYSTGYTSKTAPETTDAFTVKGLLTSYTSGNPATTTYRICPTALTDISTTAKAAAPTFNPLGGATASEAAEATSMTLTPATNTSSVYTKNAGDPVAITAATEISVEPTGTTAIAAYGIRDFYADSDPTTYYYKYPSTLVAVVFNANGTTIATVPVESGENLTAAMVPSVDAPDGFAFVGWSNSESSITLVTFPMENVTSNITLYAVYGKVVSCTYDKISSLSALTSGEYVITAMSGNYTYAIQNIEVNKNPKSDTLTISGNTIMSGISSSTWLFTVFSSTSERDSVIIQSTANTNLYLNTTNDSQAVKVNTTNTDKWVITYNDANKYFNMKSKNGGGSRYLVLYDSNKDWRNYKDTDSNIQLYKKSIVLDDARYTRIIEIADIQTLPNIFSTYKVYVKDGGVLTLTGTNNGDETNLIIEDGAQLITNNAVNATVQKNIAAHGATTADGGWYFIAFPIDGTVDPALAGLITDNEGYQATATTATYDLYRFVQNPLLEDGGNEWKNYRKNNFMLSSGAGYLYANMNDVTLSFAGNVVPNTADGVSVPLVFAGENEDTDMTCRGWNLVGNPFTFNAVVDKPYYKMNDDGSAILATEQTTGTIAPCTGIMVHVGQTGQSVTFSKEPPTTSPSNGNVSIAVVQANERGVSASTVDNAIVSFNESSELPKFYFGNPNANLYIPQGDKEYAILSAEAQGEMPLNFRANADGQYTLTVNPEGIEMNYLHLIDNMTGANVDLLSTPSYTFTAKTTDYESRFRLVFASNGTSTSSATEETFAFFSNGNLVVNNEGEATLQVIDVMGRVLSNQTISGTAELNLNQQPGVYVLRLVNGNDVKTQKIVVR